MNRLVSDKYLDKNKWQSEYEMWFWLLVRETNEKSVAKSRI